MVRNFNNLKAFVMFLVKNWKPCLSWPKNFEYAYVSPENSFRLQMLILVRKIFLTSPRQHFRGKFVRPGQNPRKCWSKHDDTPPPPPPPNVDGFATSLIKPSEQLIM